MSVKMVLFQMQHLKMKKAYQWNCNAYVLILMLLIICVMLPGSMEI